MPRRWRVSIVFSDTSSKDSSPASLHNALYIASHLHRTSCAEVTLSSLCDESTILSKMFDLVKLSSFSFEPKKELNFVPLQDLLLPQSISSPDLILFALNPGDIRTYASLLRDQLHIRSHDPSSPQHHTIRIVHLMRGVNEEYILSDMYVQYLNHTR